MIRHKGSQIRRTFVIVGAVTGSLLIPGAAWAAPGGTGHTVTETEHIHGEFDPELGPNPCTGADIVSESAFGNVVMHVTFFPDGDEVWATFTEEGKVTVLDSNGVTLMPGGGAGNAIRGNSIFSNVGGPGLGIDIGGNGVTANDLNDTDTGPNNTQNYPVLTAAAPGANTIRDGS